MQTPQVNIPARLRTAIYIVTALSAPVVAYLLAKGYIGEEAVKLYTGEVTAVAVMAAFNVSGR